MAGRSRPRPTSRSRWPCSRVISSHLPSGLRTFLLTLAVVDDLLAITVIALFYTDQPARRVPRCWPWFRSRLFACWSPTRRTPVGLLLLPLALATWALVHASGVHATVAGVLLAFAVPVRREADDGRGLAEHLEHLVRPISAGLAVPVFAFFAAGVTVGGSSGLRGRPHRPGRARGRRRPAGRQDRSGSPARPGCWPGSPGPTSTRTWRGSTWSACHCSRGSGSRSSLLIGELALRRRRAHDEHVKVGVLTGSVAAALAAAVCWVPATAPTGESRSAVGG